MICEFCRWEGEDVQEFVDDPDKKTTTRLCMACVAAVAAGTEAMTVGDLHPARLVPIFRAVVAQSVGSMLAMVMSELARATGHQEFDALVDMLRNKGSTDPN